MNNSNYKTPSKFIIYLVILTHFITGCAGTMGPKSSGVEVGPQASTSTTFEQSQQVSQALPELEVVIPVFSPGLSDKEANYEEEGVWPELRRAEANRFAYKLKIALDETGKFGAVRVTPNNIASGDIYILGEINESNGQEISFGMNVVDISGTQWLNKTIKHEVSEGFFKNPRNSGKDPYDPAFEEAAKEIVEALLKRNANELTQLQNIAELRFAASFNAQAFMPHLDTSKNQIRLVSMPSDADPMFERVRSIRVQEQLFVDNLQPTYSGFSNQMETSYLAWQEASFTEAQLRREARRKSAMQMLGGAALITAALALAFSSNNQNPNFGRDVATIAGGVGGAVLLSGGFKSREEARFHQGALNEMGESINLEMAPQVVTLEEESVELTGDIAQQFQQWRVFLNRMYELEATPDRQL